MHAQLWCLVSASVAVNVHSSDDAFCDALIEGMARMNEGNHN